MKSTDPRFKLSKHFTLGEFLVSETAARHGIDNRPTNDIVVRLKRLCENVLEPARCALGPLQITSGYRSYWLNKYVGGSGNSEHVLGRAADVVPYECTTRELANWIKKNCQWNQMILEYGTLANPDWIHVSYNHGANHKEILAIQYGTGYYNVRL